MKLSSTLLALSAVRGSLAAPRCGGPCKADACLQAIQGAGLPYGQGTADCNSFLAVTVTPSTKTVIVTHAATTTPVSYSSVTETDTIDRTETDTVSVVETEIVSITTTVYNDETVTITDTLTTSITFQYLDKRETEPLPSTTPPYASVCGNVDSYKTACSCAGAKVSTITAPTPVTTQTITVDATRPAEVIKTTVATDKLTKTVATVSVTETWTTATEQVVDATETPTRVIATKTDTAVVTQSLYPNVRTGHIEMHAVGWADFWAWAAETNSDDSAATQIYGNYGPSGSDLFQLTRSDASLVLSHSSWSENDGYYMYTSPSGVYGPNGLGGHASYLVTTSPSDAAEKQATQAECTIHTDNTFQCIWAPTGTFGDWWFCYGYLILVEPGYDASSVCTYGVSKQMTLTWYDDSS